MSEFDEKEKEAMLAFLKNMMARKKEHISKDAKVVMVIPLPPEVETRFNNIIMGIEAMTGEKVDKELFAYEVFEIGLQTYALNLLMMIEQERQRTGL